MAAVVLLGFLISAKAEITLLLNSQPYATPKAVEYFFDSGVIEVEFDDGMACSGEPASQPGDGLTVRLADQFYALQGDVLLDFSTQPMQLSMTSDSGQLGCTFDRVFSDSFMVL